MKKMIFLMAAMLTMAFSAKAMSYEQARNEALFLTDKMAYELNLTDAQYEAAYEINLDYLMGVTSEYDVYGPYWERRNLDLSYILYSWQWEAFRAATYFFRPLYWRAGYWHFGIYARYPHRDYFYFGRPHFYATYRGGHSWRLNGGRSYYEGRRGHFRSPARDSHFGMRDSWHRGDYRNSRGNSSTRITAGRNSHFEGNRSSNRGSYNGMERSGMNRNNNGVVNRNYNGDDSRRGNFSGSRNGGSYNGGSLSRESHGGMNRSSNSSGSFRSTIPSTSSSRSNFSGGSTSRSSGSFGSSGSSMRSSGSFGSGSSSTRSSGSFGSGSSSTRSSGSFGSGSSSTRSSGSFSRGGGNMGGRH